MVPRTLLLAQLSTPRTRPLFHPFQCNTALLRSLPTVDRLLGTLCLLCRPFLMMTIIIIPMIILAQVPATTVQSLQRLRLARHRPSLATLTPLL